MNWNKKIGSIIGLALLAACSPKIEEELTSRPNIIFILADDLGWADVGYNGAEYYETPNIDLIAKSGIIFSNAYANAANCAPTRASIMSGQYTSRHGVLTVNNSDRGDKKAQRLIPIPNKEVLDTTTVSLAEMLKTANYHTAFIGKWHLGNHKETSPKAHGFDYALGGWKRGSPKSYFSPYQNPALTDGPVGEHLTDRLTSEAIQYIDRQKDNEKPFFLYLSYYAVHAPFQAKDSLRAKYQQKTPTIKGQDRSVYAAMIETLDNNIGHLHQYLESEGLLKNTILVFWSDNGGSFRATVNTPLKGAKGMPYEGGIRVPAFIYAPSFFNDSNTIETPVISTDLYPTFAEWTGGKLNNNYPIDGKSLVPLLEGRSLDERAIFWYAPVYLPGSGNYAFRMKPSATMRKGDYKLIWWYGSDKTEFYNLKEDIGETKNLSNQSFKNAENLLEEIYLDELKTWHKKIGAVIPLRRNVEFDSLYTFEKYKSIGYE